MTVIMYLRVSAAAKHLGSDYGSKYGKRLRGFGDAGHS